jgi:hypothetical protein
MERSEEIVLYGLEDVKTIFGVGTNKAYQILNSNGFPAIRIGGRKVVEKESLRKWLELNKGKTVLL